MGRTTEQYPAFRLDGLYSRGIVGEVDLYDGLTVFEDELEVAVPHIGTVDKRVSYTMEQKLTG